MSSSLKGKAFNGSAPNMPSRSHLSSAIHSTTTSASVSVKSETASVGQPDLGPVEASQVNVDLLPTLHDIIRIVEKDNQDVSQKNKDSLEASQKVLELHKKIESIRDKIYKIPGIEQSKTEQLRQLDVLKRQLEAKKNLINKYKELNLKVSGLSGKQKTFQADPGTSELDEAKPRPGDMELDL